MNNVGLQGLIFNDAVRIVEAISTGAAWEVWMQVELVLILRAANLQAAREVPYPPPNQAQRLDVIAQDAQGVYAIELKVESANNAGAAIVNGIIADRNKLLNYPQPNPGARWVLAIGYSVAATQAMNNFANVPANNTICAVGAGLCVSVTRV